MAPASLLFKAISRLEFQGTTTLDVYVGEVVYCKYVSEKLYITKYSTFTSHLTIILIVILNNIYLYCHYVSHVFNMVEYFLLK